MNIEKARKVVDALNQEGIESDLREEYSGRDMFGKTTAAIVLHDDSNAFRAIQVMGDYGIENARTDNMGLRGIIYY